MNPLTQCVNSGEERGISHLSEYRDEIMCLFCCFKIVSGRNPFSQQANSIQKVRGQLNENKNEIFISHNLSQS